MSFRDMSEKILFLLFVLFPPFIVIALLWGWLSPIGFFENVIMLIVSVAFYIPLTVAWWIFINWMMD